MGVEFPVEAGSAGKRSLKRNRVLLAAKLRTSSGNVDCRLRDLSRKGALIECNDLPPVGSEVVFTRGSTSVPARVAWAGLNRAGLEFFEMIDESEVLVQLNSRSPSAQLQQQRFRRPRLHGEGLSEDARKLAEKWGLAVGIAISDD